MPSSFLFRKTKRSRNGRTSAFGRSAEGAYFAAASLVASPIRVIYLVIPLGMSSADDVRMSETPVPVTLETIAAQIDALRESTDERFDTVDQQFAKVDERFDKVDQRVEKVDQRVAKVEQRVAKVEQRVAKVDQRVAETWSQLGVKIEALEANVVKVYDEVIAMREESKRNSSEHKTFTKRLDNHDLRILALEKPGPAKP